MELAKYEGLGQRLPGARRPRGPASSSTTAWPGSRATATLVSVPTGYFGAARHRRALREQMTFELRNADGSEAEMSGNGLRCLAHAAIDSGAVTAVRATALAS